jgi:hypothetical protein
VAALEDAERPALEFPPFVLRRLVEFVAELPKTLLAQPGRADDSCAVAGAFSACMARSITPSKAAAKAALGRGVKSIVSLIGRSLLLSVVISDKPFLSFHDCFARPLRDCGLCLGLLFVAGGAVASDPLAQRRANPEARVRSSAPIAPRRLGRSDAERHPRAAGILALLRAAAHCRSWPW